MTTVFNDFHPVQTTVESFEKSSKTTTITSSSSSSPVSKKKYPLFGVSLAQLSDAHHSVPQIVKSCIAEIDQRGVQINGIYRVSGVKSKVDNLCRSLESNGLVGVKSPVDMSQISPTIISSVLKTFFREVGSVKVSTFRLELTIFVFFCFRSCPNLS